ncbi:putative sporulation protein YyaC [Alkalithermobacter thermoalcaliphilus JW-YL-7 = DSM 7308]|uniref:Sporulation protein YyaC n=1 Tax=Alkalithermobacter thermoalcaliphilus JW-YL-7 = DSM 7308 TaxID=1121328 RepID=A0A150FN39_CLOPD|nr:sporulation protein YyaC [[Clostridium] paradoxum JW-YL-7 = DSM 7308]SHL05449.1 putative sporulation protein YyaC [[Clostridium] paradoxum JW-YL-7 = DSM 7308]
MYIVKANYKEDDCVNILTTALKEIINNKTVIVCIGTDRCIGDSLGPIVGTMLKNSDYKYPVYGTLESPIHALNIYEALSEIKKKHPDGLFLALDACLGDKENIGTIQIRKGPILPGKGVGKTLPQTGDFSIVAIVDQIDEDIKFTFNNIRLNFIVEMSEIIATSIILAT